MHHTTVFAGSVVLLMINSLCPHLFPNCVRTNVMYRMWFLLANCQHFIGTIRRWKCFQMMPMFGWLWKTGIDTKFISLVAQISAHVLSFLCGLLSYQHCSISIQAIQHGRLCDHKGKVIISTIWYEESVKLSTFLMTFSDFFCCSLK